MKKLLVLILLSTSISFSALADLGPGDCIAVIYHNSAFASPDPQDRDLPYVIVRWDEVNLTHSALPIVMIKVKFDIFGAGSEIRFSGALYYNITYVASSSHDPEGRLVVKEFSQPNSAQMHEVGSDGKQLLGKSVPNALAKLIIFGAHAHYYTTEDDDFVGLQDRARALDVGVCSTL